MLVSLQQIFLHIYFPNIGCELKGAKPTVKYAVDVDDNLLTGVSDFLTAHKTVTAKVSIGRVKYILSITSHR